MRAKLRALPGTPSSTGGWGFWNGLGCDELGVMCR